MITFETLSQQEKVEKVFRGGKLLQMDTVAGRMMALFSVDEVKVRVLYPQDEWDDMNFEVVG